MRRWAAVIMAVAVAGCVARPDPEPAVVREGPPPWDAPRDAISYIRDAGLPEVPLDSRDDPWVVDLTIQVDGEPVEVPAYIGVDRLRAVQAPVHTHDASGTVWLEGEGNRDVTLGQFFHVWGVHFDGACLADACQDLTVTADGQVVDQPTSFVLHGTKELNLSVRRG